MTAAVLKCKQCNEAHLPHGTSDTAVPYKMNRCPYRRSHGFTMIELMVTLVVLGILVGVGIPSFNTIMVNSRTSGLANDLTSAINLARSEAVKRAEQVTVCPSDDATTCSGAWTDGWIAIVDASSEVLRTWPAPFADAEFTHTPTATANQPIDFGALGQLVSPATEIIVEVDGCRGERARQLDIGPAGRVSVERVDCST